MFRLHKYQFFVFFCPSLINKVMRFISPIAIHVGYLNVHAFYRINLARLQGGWFFF